MAVSGRRGVGSSTVAQALRCAGITVTTPADADLDVYVLADAVKPEDQAALAGATRPLLAVLNKADLVATAATGLHPNGPTEAARARCAALSVRAGTPVEPLVAVLAVAPLDECAWTALHDQRPRVPALDTFGTRQARSAIRRGATRDDIKTLLRGLSNIDAVVARLGVLGAQLRYQRVREAVAELEAMAVTDQRIGDFLSCDATVIAQMMAAVDAAESVGMPVDRGDTADDHLRRAARWERHRRGPAVGVRRVCGADIVRGSLRLWAKAGGSI